MDLGRAEDYVQVFIATQPGRGWRGAYLDRGERQIDIQGLVLLLLVGTRIHGEQRRGRVVMIVIVMMMVIIVVVILHRERCQ